MRQADKARMFGKAWLETVGLTVYHTDDGKEFREKEWCNECGRLITDDLGYHHTCFCQKVTLWERFVHGRSALRIIYVNEVQLYKSKNEFVHSPIFFKIPCFKIISIHTFLTLPSCIKLIRLDCLTKHEWKLLPDKIYWWRKYFERNLEKWCNECGGS